VETKVNYAIVGLFVLVLATALIGGILWLSAGKQYRKDYDGYLAYMRESVSGLNLNAPVKYRGVDVGNVREIGLDPGNTEQVRLKLDIERGTPVKTDTVAVLKVQGLTGIAYVELAGGSRDAPPLGAEGKQEYPVIKTGPSLLARLDTALTEVVTNLNRTAANINAVLDEDNRRSFKRTLADLATLSHTLAGRTGTMDSGVADAASTLKNTARASAELPKLLERIGRSADAVDKLAAEIGRTNVAAGDALQGVRGDVRRFTGESLPELEKTLAEVRELTASAQRVARELEQSPSALLYGKQPAPPGPGE
jgi:phospholipid/cholesterol/gamma-HCH transport system substrate-binding protein